MTSQADYHLTGPFLMRKSFNACLYMLTAPNLILVTKRIHPLKLFSPLLKKSEAKIKLPSL